MDYSPFNSSRDDQGRLILTVKPDGPIKYLTCKYQIVDGKQLVATVSGAQQTMEVADAVWHIRNRGWIRNHLNKLIGTGTIVFTASGSQDQVWESVPRPNQIGQVFDQIKRQLRNPPSLSDRVVRMNGLPEVILARLRPRFSSKRFAQPAVSVGEYVEPGDPLIVFGKRPKYSQGTASSPTAGAIRAPAKGRVNRIEGTSFEIQVNDQVFDHLMAPNYYLGEIMDLLAEYGHNELIGALREKVEIQVTGGGANGG